MRMDNDTARRLFEDAGALLKGHFLLSSGLHSSEYLEKFRLVERPVVLEAMCAELADHYRGRGVDIVLGPTTAGIILAYSVARHLGVEGRYAEPGESGRELRRGQSLSPSARVLVVDDILTTGLSVRECLSVVAAHGATPLGIGVLGDRSGGSVTLGLPIEALLKTSMPAYPPAECPMCREGAPLVKPGTRGALTKAPKTGGAPDVSP